MENPNSWLGTSEKGLLVNWKCFKGLTGEAAEWQKGPGQLEGRETSDSVGLAVGSWLAAPEL